MSAHPGRLAIDQSPVLDMGRFWPVPEQGVLVGGAVRDALLGRTSSDIDWLVPDPRQDAATAASLLKGSFFALDESRRHFRVVADSQKRDYLPLAEPLQDNLLARDYTVNALAARQDGAIVDVCGGIPDLRAGRLRMVGSANLAADPLRPLRGVRFAAELGFEVEPATRQVILSLARSQRAQSNLPAWERVAAELTRIVSSDHAVRGMRLLAELDLLGLYLPELAATAFVEQGGHHHADVLGHQLEALEVLISEFPEADVSLRLATLIHDIGKPAKRHYDHQRGYHRFLGHEGAGAKLANRLLRRLRLPNSVVTRVCTLVARHGLPVPQSDLEVRRFVHRNLELLPDLLKLKIADQEAKRGPQATNAGRERARHAYQLVTAQLRESPPSPPLMRGDEVMDVLDLEEGPKVGEALSYLHEEQALGRVADRDEAVALVKRYAAERGW